MIKGRLEKHFHRKLFIYNNYQNYNSSKILYIWSFNLEGKFHKIEFWDSKLSNKKKLTVDAKELLNDKSSSNQFSYSFSIDKHFFSLLKDEEDFALKIDNRSFIEIMHDERCGKLIKKKEKKENKKEVNYYNESPNKMQKKNKVEQEDFDFGTKEDDYNDEKNDRYNNEKRNNNPFNFSIKNRENREEEDDEGGDIIDDFDVEQIKNNLSQENNNMRKIESQNYNNNNYNNNNERFNNKRNDSFNHNRQIFDNLDLFNNNDNENNNNKQMFNNFQNNNCNNPYPDFFNNDLNSNMNNQNKRNKNYDSEAYLNQMAQNLANAKNPHNQQVLNQMMNFESSNNNNINNNNNNNNNDLLDIFSDNNNNSNNNNYRFNQNQNNNQYNNQMNNNNGNFINQNQYSNFNLNRNNNNINNNFNRNNNFNENNQNNNNGNNFNFGGNNQNMNNNINFGMFDNNLQMEQFQRPKGYTVTVSLFINFIKIIE